MSEGTYKYISKEDLKDVHVGGGCLGECFCLSQGSPSVSPRASSLGAISSYPFLGTHSSSSSSSSSSPLPVHGGRQAVEAWAGRAFEGSWSSASSSPRSVFSPASSSASSVSSPSTPGVN